MSILCIDVGGTFIKYAVMDGKEKLIESERTETPKDSLCGFMDVILKLYRQFEGIEGIALSIPGILDYKQGYLYNGGSLHYIHNLPLAHMISQACSGIPVTVENDAKAAATAELESGVLINSKNAVVLTIGTAIGGTIIINRELLRGKNLFAGELSYVIFDTSGEINLENKRSRLWTSHGVPTQICSFYGDKEIDTEEIMARLINGEKKAEEAVRRSAKELAMLLYNLQCIIDPEIIAVGGGISAQQAYIDILKEETEALGIIGGPVPDIQACKYRNNANIVGAYYAFKRQYGA